MKKKSLLAVVLCVFVLSSVASCAQKKKDEKMKNPIISVILQADAIDDSEFAKSVVSSLEDIQEDVDVDIRFLENLDGESADVVVDEAVNEGSNLVIAVGNDITNIIEEKSLQYSKTKFAILNGKSDKPTVKSVEFKTGESGFLAGYAAAKTGTTQNIGFIAVDKSEDMSENEIGFTAGAKYAQKDVKIHVRRMNQTDSISDAFDIASELFEEKNADVIYHKTDAMGRGIIEAADKLGFKVIGSEKDQSYINAKHVLCSTTKNVKLAMRDMIDELLKGKFQNDYVLYTLANDGVDLKDKAGNLDAQLQKEIEALRERIVKKEIAVPATKDELEKFINGI